MNSFISFDQMQTMLSDLCDELPDTFFNELNLGVVLREQIKISEKSRSDAPLFIMGEYTRNKLGRQIFIYYGSFKQVYDHVAEEALKGHLRHTLRHEFRHHLEYLAGERELEIEDYKQLAAYLGGYRV